MVLCGVCVCVPRGEGRRGRGSLTWRLGLKLYVRRRSIPQSNSYTQKWGDTHAETGRLASSDSVTNPGCHSLGNRASGSAVMADWAVNWSSRPGRAVVPTDSAPEEEHIRYGTCWCVYVVVVSRYSNSLGWCNRGGRAVVAGGAQPSRGTREGSRVREVATGVLGRPRGAVSANSIASGEEEDHKTRASCGATARARHGNTHGVLVFASTEHAYPAGQTRSDFVTPRTMNVPAVCPAKVPVGQNSPCSQSNAVVESYEQYLPAGHGSLAAEPSGQYCPLPEVHATGWSWDDDAQKDPMGQGVPSWSLPVAVHP